MKKLAILFTCILLLSGCDHVSSHLFINQRENKTSTSWSMSYTTFQGYESRRVTLHKDDLLNIDSTTSQGTLHVIVMQDDTMIYQSEDNPEQEQFAIQEAGEYRIKVVADSHQGSFMINW